MAYARVGRNAMMAFAAAAVTQVASVEEARAESCRELGGIGVAVGAMIGGGTAVASSFALPGIAVAVEPSGDLNYWPGVGWTFLGASTGVGAGAAVSAAAVCDAGLYLPALNGFGIGLASTIVWAAVTPTEPESDRAPDSLPVSGPQVSVVPLDDDGAAIVLAAAF